MEAIFKDNNRQVWIDIAKAIAIIAVIIGHTIPAYSMLSKFIYLFHMPLFFLISGYLFNFKKYEQSLGGYIISCAKRLLLPCVVTILVFYNFNYIISNVYVFLYASPININVFGQPIEPIQLSMWFLFCLFLTKIILYFFLKILKHYNIGTFIGIILSFMVCLAGVKLGENIKLPWSLDVAMVGFYISYVGYIMRESKFFNAGKFIHVTLAIIFLILGYIDYKYFGLSMAYRIYTNPFISINAAIGISILFFYFSILLEKMKQHKITNKLIYFVSYIGVNSIIIMLAHGLVPYVTNYMKTIILRIAISLIIVEIIARIPHVKNIFGAKGIRYQ